MKVMPSTMMVLRNIMNGNLKRTGQCPLTVRAI
jgi:hypothetical protein